MNRTLSWITRSNTGPPQVHWLKEVQNVKWPSQETVFYNTIGPAAWGPNCLGSDLHTCKFTLSIFYLRWAIFDPFVTWPVHFVMGYVKISNTHFTNAVRTEVWLYFPPFLQRTLSRPVRTSVASRSNTSAAVRVRLDQGGKMMLSSVFIIYHIAGQSELF